MSDTGAVFQEIIGIEFDAAGFSQSLDELAAIYEQKLEEMSSKGINLSEAINSSGLNELSSRLSDTVEEVKALSDAMAESFGKTSDGSSEATEKLKDLKDAIKETDDAAEKLKSSGGVSGVFSSFKEGLLGGDTLNPNNIAEMTGTLLQWRLIWGGIGLAIQAVQLPVEKFIEGFKEGFDYLANLEQKAYELTGVLDANVKFSDDLKENFKAASQAAPEVVKALQDVAAATGLKPDTLMRSFNALTESGGAGAVNNLQELVDLTELFNLAMRSAGASVETSRLLISQMPNAMSGNISATSKWLEVLHMAPDEWNKMVKLGLEHHDLLQRLQSAMKPYLDATDQAALNEEILTNKVNILKERLEATFVAPYFDAYKKFLQDVVDLLGTADTKAQSMNKALAEASNAHMAKEHPWWMTLIAAAGVDTPGGGTAFPSETSQTQFIDDFNKALNDSLSQKITAKHEPPVKPNNDLLDALRDDFTKTLQKNKDDYQKALADIDEAEREHTISVETATDKRIQAVLAEKKANDALIASVRNRLATVGGTTRARGSLSTQLDKAQEASDTSARTAVDKDYSQYTTNQLQVEESALRSEMQLSRQKHDAAIQLAKEEGATHVEIVNMEIAADKEYFQKWQQQINIQKTLAGQNEKALQDVKDAQANLDQQRDEKEKQRQAELANGYIADQTEKIALETQVANKTLQASDAKLAADKRSGASTNSLNQERKALLKTYLDEATRIEQDIRATLDQAEALGVQGEAVDKLRKDYEALEASKSKAVARNTADQHRAIFDKIDLDGSTPSLGSDFNDFASQIQDWKAGNKSFGDATNILVTGFKAFSNSVTTFVDAYRQGAKQGGVLGGIGAVAQQGGGMLSSLGSGLSGMTGILGSIGAFAGPAGAIMSVAGSMFSMIGGLFTAAAKHIAEQIKKSVDDIMQAYGAGDKTLAQTITALQQQRAQAIAQLSGKKGGKDQLNQLLPQIDQQIASLQQQQKQIITNFEQQVAVLEQHNKVLGDALSTWQQINKQIKDYLDAGGDVAKAQAFLSDQLQQMQKSAGDEINNQNQTAINDAINLNSLLKQRVDLQKQFAATIFGLETQDSIERRGSNAIMVGTQINQQRQQFAQQMSDLDNQISLTQQKVSLEGQIFDINKSVAQLQADSNALTIKSLNEQLDLIKAQQEIYNGIYKDASGNYAVNGALAGVLGPSSMPITINVNTGGAPVDPSDLADKLSSELRRRGRYGLSPSLDQQY